LTVLQDEQFGLFGGYLVLNTAARPLEFHCTSPIKPTRAQEILYGPTLEPYLYGEQIGAALVKAAKIRPLVVWTDRAPALAVRRCIDRPVALVLPPENHQAGLCANPADARPGSAARRDDVARALGLETANPLLVFDLGINRVALGREWAAEKEQIECSFGRLAEWFDLGEPFERIRLAIDEARGAARAA